VTDDNPYAGIIAPPLRYPDGHWYVKGAGASLLEAPLHTADEIAAWVRTGGDAADRAPFAALLEELLPGVTIEGLTTRPCLVTLNATGHPYIGFVDDGVVVATEGDHGVTMADEIGRLAARLAIDGRWRDSLPAEPFAPRYADRL
jgi:sarcosine oxidase